MNSKPKITLTPGVHRGQEIIKVLFTYDRKIVDILERETPARRSTHLRYWYIFKEKFILGDFFAIMKAVAYIDYSGLTNKSSQKSINKEKKYSAMYLKIQLPRTSKIKIESFKLWMRQLRFSENTIKIY